MADAVSLPDQSSYKVFELPLEMVFPTDPGIRKRKRAIAEAAARQQPPDNEMRRKLRGTFADSGDDVGRAGGPEQGGGSRASSQPPGLSEDGDGAPPGVVHSRLQQALCMLALLHPWCRALQVAPVR